MMHVVKLPIKWKVYLVRCKSDIVANALIVLLINILKENIENEFQI